MTGFVYLIAPVSLCAVKIGYTAGLPSDRLKQLQTGSPEPLFVLSYVRATQAVEANLHARFRGYHSHLEWFFAKGALRAFIREIRLRKSAPDGEIGGQDFVEAFLSIEAYEAKQDHVVRAIECEASADPYLDIPKSGPSTFRSLKCVVEVA